MKLTFKTPYLSIDPFDPVDLPDFVVLTGVNGSGKSHLMAAIAKRDVIVQGMENEHIVSFNYEDFKLDNEAAFNAQQLSSERDGAWQYYQQSIKKSVQGWRSRLGPQYEALKQLCKNENKSFLSLSTQAIRTYKQQFKKHFAQDVVRNQPHSQGIVSLAKQLPYSIDEIEHDEFLRLYKPFLFKNDFLPLQLGKVFWDYYIRYRNNELNEFQNAKHNKHYPTLTEEDFTKLHGVKPWEAVNAILKGFDTLKYEVTSPETFDFLGNFQLKLKHTEKPNLQIEFSQLSSGERVLMALVASVYKSASDRHFPDLLLLDEVDASLHPSMMKNMLDVIKRIFLDQGVKVILVTHSPTTIALAPEESVFVMNQSGPNRIEKKTQPEALSILTQGFATMEQGLKLFDQVAKSQLSVITEGYNSQLITKALELAGVGNVDVLSGFEGMSGKNQLKTIFQFFTKADHKSKVMFVWDCDAPTGLLAENNTFPFVLPHNVNNTIVRKGIENAFPVHLFADFMKEIKPSKGPVTTEFDTNRKRDFASFVIQRSCASDFAHFASLVAEITRITNL